MRGRGLVVKALTLQQPWATLIAIGVKEVETRKWHPKENPGRLVICSSKKPLTGPAHERLLASPPFALCLKGRETPRSSMLAIATLARCVRTDELNRTALSKTEFAFGDYRPGRWAWFLEDVTALPEPVPLSDPPRRPGQKKQFRLGVWELLPKDQRNLDAALAACGA